MNVRQYNIRFLGNYIKNNFDDEYKVMDATIILQSIKESKKYGKRNTKNTKTVPNK